MISDVDRMTVNLTDKKQNTKIGCTLKISKYLCGLHIVLYDK